MLVLDVPIEEMSLEKRCKRAMISWFENAKEFGSTYTNLLSTSNKNALRQLIQENKIKSYDLVFKNVVINTIYEYSGDYFMFENQYSEEEKLYHRMDIK